MLGLTDAFYQQVYRDVMGQPAFGLVPVLLRPQSRGRISLKSTNPFHWPRMEPNFYTDRNDLTRLIEGVRMVCNLFHTCSSFKLLCMYDSRRAFNWHMRRVSNSSALDCMTHHFPVASRCPFKVTPIGSAASDGMPPVCSIRWAPAKWDRSVIRQRW